MKFKGLVYLTTKLLGLDDNGDEPRADMYLPGWILGMGIVLISGGVAVGIYGVAKATVGALVCGVLALLLGILAVLCWRNQKIRVTSETTFEYTTFLGKTYEYQFSQIRGLRQNQDSMTMFVGDDKVHMEACAIISERLAEKINEQLARLYPEEHQNNT